MNMPIPTVQELADRLGKTFFPWQLDFFEGWAVQTSKRACLYHRTGAGKSISALCAVVLAGHDEVLVIAPPVTHRDWEALGTQLGVMVEAISHAKFRMKDYRTSRKKAVICDEFHLLGGHKGQGWKKFDRMAAHLQAPLIVASATPNYNDAERCYCIQHVLDPRSLLGGYIEFLYRTCTTVPNQFGLEPIVTGFLHHRNAEHYLSELPGVYYVPDNVAFNIVDLLIPDNVPLEFEDLGLCRRKNRIMASQMEERWQRIHYALVDDEGRIRDAVYDILTELAGQATTPVLMFCNSSSIARTLFRTLEDHGVRAAVITGDTPKKQKELLVGLFKQGGLDVLVGTATMATGLDGVDKVCNTLIIVNDIDGDHSLRRQLIGRILPRGEDSDATGKHIYRLVVNDAP